MKSTKAEHDALRDRLSPCPRESHCQPMTAKLSKIECKRKLDEYSDLKELELIENDWINE